MPDLAAIWLCAAGVIVHLELIDALVRPGRQKPTAERLKTLWSELWTYSAELRDRAGWPDPTGQSWWSLTANHQDVVEHCGEQSWAYCWLLLDWALDALRLLETSGKEAKAPDSQLTALAQDPDVRPILARWKAFRKQWLTRWPHGFGGQRLAAVIYKEVESATQHSVKAVPVLKAPAEPAVASENMAVRADNFQVLFAADLPESLSDLAKALRNCKRGQQRRTAIQFYEKKGLTRDAAEQRADSNLRQLRAYRAGDRGRAK